MKKILFSVAIIAAVGAIAFGATRAYFSDAQSVTGNTISAGTLDLQLMCPAVTTQHIDAMHPETGNDTTGVNTNYALDASDLTAISASDDSRYTSKYAWYNSYLTNEGTEPYDFFNFGIPNLPTGTTISASTLTIEWQRGTGITASRVRVYDGSVWQIVPLTLPAFNTDTTQVIDLFALGIDTEAELDALQVQFQATQFGGYNANDPASKTQIDLVQVDASYSTTVGPNWCDDALTNGFNVTNIAPGATGNAVIEYKNNGTINGNLTMTVSNIVDADNNCNGPETTAGDVTCGPADGGEMSQYLNLYNGSTNLGTLASIAATPVSLGAVAANTNSSLTLGYELPSATGNIVQSDGVTFDVNFTLVQ